ncbi:MAG: tetratricopeptide repeat protein, partial [Hyphomicrobiaceae bacterium]|nr:tetratricopeptide repeat protein [Hyphomicrobiaceae bacterium]
VVISSVVLLGLLGFALRLDAAILARLRSPDWGFGQDRRGIARTLIVAGVVFVLVAGVGAATSYLRDASRATGSQDEIAQAHSGANGETLTRLKDYARSIGTDESASPEAPDKLLPDVNTMIERLAARLETAPGDIKGWRMLGWSYFNVGRYKQAAAAYGKAVELDPNSAELKASYAEAKAKAAESEKLQTTSAEAASKGGDGPGMKGSEGMSPSERDAFIRSMVDGLAARLESSPQDVEGWTRLMRSRVVLGEREVATTTLRKALEVFKDDPAATGKITAAATELGLKAQ